jgi:dodecin
VGSIDQSFRRESCGCNLRPSTPRGNREPAGVELGRRQAIEKEETLAAVKIIELIGTSSKSSDDAVQQALTEARTSLRNIKAVDLVSTGLRGDNLDEWRAHVRVAFLVERVGE